MTKATRLIDRTAVTHEWRSCRQLRADRTRLGACAVQTGSHELTHGTGFLTAHACSVTRRFMTRPTTLCTIGLTAGDHPV